MSLKYTCPSCGPHWVMRDCVGNVSASKNGKLLWPGCRNKLSKKQRNLIQNIQRLADMEDPEFTDFWQLLSYHDAITPEIQRVHWPQRCSGPVRSIIMLPPMCGMV